MTIEDIYMTRCFELASQGKGLVSPNPLVGSIIVKSDEVIAEGWHKRSGASHAEVNAFNNAKEDVAGATLYCNLEPCCHTNKQTPPCVPLIVSKGIKKVVISNLDPNPFVNGKGIKQLRDSGVEVVSGILDVEGKMLNKFYFKFIKENTPFITIKIARSFDGFLSKSKYEQTWLTGKEASLFVHQQRARYDAVLVGANTIRVDDPQLTVREVEGRNPIRIIIDGSLSLPLSSKVICTSDKNKTWIFTGENSNKEKIKKLKKLDIKLFFLPLDKSGKSKLEDILKKLAVENITSLFVEGGQEIFNQFISHKLFDDLIILQSPNVLGKGISCLEFETEKWTKIESSEKLGDDLKILIKKII
jgi:diaminohydroxyphosphoribosylaminopyrimidine deaminase/5-amino-6-(5-phosphoribosylamino)uracil reductase